MPNRDCLSRIVQLPFSRLISAWTREMSAPDRRRSVSLRRPIVKSGLSIGHDPPAERVGHDQTRGASGSAMEERDYSPVDAERGGIMKLRSGAFDMKRRTSFCRHRPAAGLARGAPRRAQTAPAQPRSPAADQRAVLDRHVRRRVVRARDGRPAGARARHARPPPRRQGARTIDNTLRPYDDVLLELDAVGSQAGLIQVVHPDAKVRQTAEQISQKASAFATELSLNRGVYDALGGARREPRRRGDEVLRAADAARLPAGRRRQGRADAQAHPAAARRAGAHRPGLRPQHPHRPADGDGQERRRSSTACRPTSSRGTSPTPTATITLTIDYPDSLPVFSYAKNEDLRKRMYMEYNNRAYPKNIEVLDKMIAKRAELARLIGFSSWADYITADKMVGKREERVRLHRPHRRGVGAESAQREYETLLKRKQQDVPGATVVNAWENTYYAELVRKASYDFDSQSVRPYFPFDRVKQGLFDVTSTLFGVTYRPLKDAPVWDPSVEAYEMLEDGTLVGRFYLDMHPRPNKYNHAAEFGIRTGVAGRQIPEAALVCNLPGGEPGDPGLMTHDDVVTFFHEFGHLVHALLAGHHQWVGIGGTSTEQDFVEAPSQMLEEWTWDPATLATFAKHYQTNEPIPGGAREADAARERVRQGARRPAADGLREAVAVDVRPRSEVGRHDGDGQGPDERSTGRSRTSRARTSRPRSAISTATRPCTTRTCGRSSSPRTCSASSIARTCSRRPSHKYRDTILAPGGSKPAAALVRDFLGRPFDFRAWEELAESRGEMVVILYSLFLGLKP